MAEKELSINVKVKKEDSQLRELRKNVADASNEYLKLKSSTTASSKEIQAAGEKVRAANREYTNAKKSLQEYSAASRNQGRNLLALGRDMTIVMHGVRQLGAALRNALTTGAEYGVLFDNFTKISGGIDIAIQKLELLRAASTGNLNNKELMEYANHMQLLGFNTDQTARLLDIVDVQSDKVNIGFSQGEKILQKYILTGRDKSLMELGINVAETTKAIMRQHPELGKTADEMKKNIKLLDDETQQRIRYDAILGLNIGTTGDLINKQRDEADKIKAVETALQNVTLNYQYTIAHGIVKYAASLGLSDVAMEKTIGKIGFVGKGLTDLLPVLAALKIAFPAALSAALPVLGAVALQIGGLILLVKSFTDSIPAMVNAFTFARDIISGENISESFQKGVDRHEKQNQKTSEELGIDIGNKYVDGIVKGIQEKKSLAEEKLKLDETIKKQLGVKTPGTKAPKTKKPENEIDKLLKSISEEIRLNELQKTLTPEFISSQKEKINAINLENLVTADKIKLLEKLLELSEKLAEIKPKAILPEKTGRSGEVPREAVGIGRRNNNPGRDAGIEQAERIQAIWDQIHEKQRSVFDQSLSITQQIDQLLGGGASEVLSAFQQAYSLTVSIVELINTLNAMESLFSFLPGGGAIAAIPGLADGGSAKPGKLYRWNEIGDELFISRGGGTMITARDFAEFKGAISTMGAAMNASNRNHEYVNMYNGKAGNNRQQPITVVNHFHGELSAVGSYKTLEKAMEFGEKKGVEIV